MDYLDLDSLPAERTRWLSLGGVEFLIRYSSPRESDKFRRRLIAEGIMRIKDGSADINAGREQAFYVAFAEHYILGWRGAVKPEGAPYKASKMAEVLAARGDVLRAIQQAVQEDEAFFGQNGRGPTES